VLKNTFCHLPGVSAAEERGLWAAGVHCWEDLGRRTEESYQPLARRLADSFERLAHGDPRYFADALPAAEHWRLFPEFRRSIAYLDIETTGMGPRAAITTVSIYDGREVRCYVSGENLQQFPYDVRDYGLLVTYNGKAFDVPFIERFFGTKLHHAHIDLMHVLRRLGYTGGLKGCERKLGIDRKELSDLDGYFAVLLWQDYQARRNRKALETLLAYNVQDVVNLETLMVKAYNMHLKGTPFSRALEAKLPAPPAVPFAADVETIERIKRQNSRRYY
jgi:uncharacterized protein